MNFYEVFVVTFATAVVMPRFNKTNMNKFREFLELRAFGVCSALGERLGIASTKIRMWFIYISFLTMGSPIIIYMILAFVRNIKNYVLAARRNPLKDF